jgi:hypothetical protein
MNFQELIQPRLEQTMSSVEQTTPSAQIFSKSKMLMGKYLKKSCPKLLSEQTFFKFVLNMLPLSAEGS